MKKEEREYLEQEKLRNGKTRKQAQLEIKKLNESQKGFKNLNKELKQKDREILRLEKQIDKLQKSHFKTILPKLDKKGGNKIKEK